MRLALLALLASERAYAAQLVQHSDSAPVQVNVSAAETNRLAVEGRRIARVVPGQAGVLSVERDEAQGVLYFKPLVGAASTGTITIFVTDDQGGSYRLVLVPRAVSGEDIVIRPARASVGAQTSNGDEAPAPTYQRRIKNLVLAMAQGERLSTRETLAAEVPLWQEARLLRTGRLLEEDLVGDIYRLTNVSADSLLIEEQELYRTGVLAVSVAVHTLAPGASTELYIVRERPRHE